ncbi:MAG TPA: hypothetical protein VM123_13265 [archaeon]|nr:hypothetical protein [archaeon]
MKKLSFFPLIAAVFLFISCSDNSPLTPRSSTSSPELTGDIVEVNSADTWVNPMPDFDYSDTIYAKDYRVDAFPEDLLEYYLYYKTLIYPDGEPVYALYIFPPSLCGDFVLIQEDGGVARLRRRIPGCQ